MGASSRKTKKKKTYKKKCSLTNPIPHPWREVLGAVTRICLARGYAGAGARQRRPKNDGFRLRARGFEWIDGARARGGFLISKALGDGSLGALDKSSCETFQMMINVSHTFPAIDPTHVVLDDNNYWSTPFIMRV